MKTLNDSSKNSICCECGSELIFVEESTYLIGNSFSPITKTIYRCSNKTCQEESDRREAAKIKLKQEQELAKEKRKLVSAEAAKAVKSI